MIRVLFFDDDLPNVELCLQELKKAQFAISADVVKTPADFIERLRKEFNPSEARVPAGNGIVSGRWTAGGDSASAAAQLEGEVNPRTITPAADNKTLHDGPEIAARACYRHVIVNSLGEHANDNWREIWIWDCQYTKKQAEAAAITIETNPKATGAVVGFPDGGIVIMKKGKADIYLPSAGREYFRRRI